MLLCIVFHRAAVNAASEIEKHQRRSAMPMTWTQGVLLQRSRASRKWSRCSSPYPAPSCACTARRENRGGSRGTSLTCVLFFFPANEHKLTTVTNILLRGFLTTAILSSKKGAGPKAEPLGKYIAMFDDVRSSIGSDDGVQTDRNLDCVMI